MMFFTLASTFLVTRFELYFLPSSLLIHLHVSLKIFGSFIKTCVFKSSVLFETHTLLDKSLRVLQLLTHLSNLI